MSEPGSNGTDRAAAATARENTGPAPHVRRRPRIRPAASPLLRFLALNAAIGAALGQIALGLLIWTDAAGLGGLIAKAADPLAPLAVLSFMFALTFGAAVTATAVLTLPYPKGDEPHER